jgi:hypothetical protein
MLRPPRPAANVILDVKEVQSKFNVILAARRAIARKMLTILELTIANLAGRNTRMKFMPPSLTFHPDRKILIQMLVHPKSSMRFGLHTTTLNLEKRSFTLVPGEWNACWKPKSQARKTASE